MGVDIEVCIDALLEKDQRSFYWLSKETGVSYTTLWRLKKGKALGINFSTLKKLCLALKCEPGDLMSLAGQVRKTSSTASRTPKNAKSAAARRN